MSRVRADRYTDRAGTGSPTFSEGVNVIGISSLGITTVTGVGQTALTVNGDTRITGVLTVGQGSVTIDGTSGSSSITGVTTAGIGSVYGVDSINDLGFPTAGPLSNRNMIINGACMVSQRLGSGTYTLNNNDYYPVDRFRSWAIGGGQFTIQRSDNAPPGFKNSLMFTVSTADTSIASGDYYTLQQRVEGYNFAHLNWGTNNAKPVTLSFWVKADLTGRYGISFWPSGQNYNYVTHYTINTADTWEYKTITIPPATSGTWLTDNGNGFGIWWDFGVGTTYSTATTETWGQVSKFAPSDTVKMIETSGAKFRMTGVQLEVGERATPFEHKSYGDELALCQRYYQSLGTVFLSLEASSANNNDSSRYSQFVSLSPVMRAAGTYADSGSHNNINGTPSPSVTLRSLFINGISRNTSGSTNAGRVNGVTLDAEL